MSNPVVEHQGALVDPGRRDGRRIAELDGAIAQQGAEARWEFRPAPKQNTAVRKIVAEVAGWYEITPHQLLSRDSHRPIPEAKARVCLILRRRKYSLNQIAQVFGMHHTSVMAAICRAEKTQAQRNSGLALEIPVPDLSGEWAI